MKDTIIKKIAIIIIIMSFFTILFSNNTFAAEDDEDHIYTIEEIIFNKVPVFDVNFFSQTAGGEEIKEGSVVYILRQIVSTWYISIRNLVIMALGIIIIYTGIRIALSTIPSGKSKFKQMLVGWVKALIIVLTMHYIMLIVLNFNDILLEIMSKAEVNFMLQSSYAEESIYDTIRTRAYEMSPIIGLTGMVMYISLVVIWVRFIWVYLKRMFTILILVVIAPFIGAKYAIDSVSGKRGNSFSSWFYDFIMNVLLQSVHAVVYTALISSALTFAMNSIVGFIIALTFFNFMLKADEIFRNIFNFDKSKLVGDTAKQEGLKDIVNDFAGIAFVGGIVSGTYGLYRGSVKGISKKASKLGKSIYGKVSPEGKEIVNNYLDKWDRRQEEMFEGKEDNFSKMMYNQAKIRRLSRQKGSMGIKAKALKKKLSVQRKKRFTSNYKFIKDTVVGTGSIVLAVPMAVVSPGVGAALVTKGISNFKKLPKKKNYDTRKSKNLLLRLGRSTGIYKTYYGSKKAKEKYEKKRNSIYKSIENISQINMAEEDIRNKYDDIMKKNNVKDKDASRFKEVTSSIVFEANSEKIDSIIERYLRDKDITSIDNSSINDIIEEVVKQLGHNIQLNSTMTNQIESRAKSSIISKNARAKMKYKKDEIATKIAETVIDETVDNKFSDVAKDIIKLENKINEAEKKSKTNYRHANKFLDNL